MAKGWAKIDRRITGHWLWKSEPFSKAQAWIDLILSANHTPTKINIKGTIIPLSIGDQARSEITLSKTWLWSRGKVRRFLKLLEKDGMIIQQAGHLTSVISICNYTTYQDSASVNGTTNSTSGGTTGGQQAGHSKEFKNEKKNNTSEETEGDVKNICDKDVELAEWIYDKILIRIPKTKKPNFNKWADTVRLMRQQDKFTHREIAEVFKWANNDGFWGGIILSPTNLRKQFAQLHAKANPKQPEQETENLL